MIKISDLHTYIKTHVWAYMHTQNYAYMCEHIHIHTLHTHVPTHYRLSNSNIFSMVRNLCPPPPHNLCWDLVCLCLLRFYSYFHNNKRYICEADLLCPEKYCVLDEICLLWTSLSLAGGVNMISISGLG